MGLIVSFRLDVPDLRSRACYFAAGVTDVGFGPSGEFGLSNHFTFDFAKAPDFRLDFPGTVEVSSIPEPSGIVMLLIGMTPPLAVVLGSTRRRVA
jgi:hypothetical protein